MEEILQDINEFPMVGFGVCTLLIMIFLWLCKSYKPPYFPCKHWKILGIICLIIFCFIVTWGDSDTIIFKENLSALTKIEGNLMYREPRRGTRGGYYLIDDDGKRITDILDFCLCGNAELVDPYLGKKIIAYSKNSIVYQMELDGDIIFEISRSNQKVWLGNLFYLFYCVTWFSFVLLVYLVQLRVWNNDYKKEI